MIVFIIVPCERLECWRPLNSWVLCPLTSISHCLLTTLAPPLTARLSYCPFHSQMLTSLQQ